MAQSTKGQVGFNSSANQSGESSEITLESSDGSVQIVQTPNGFDIQIQSLCELVQSLEDNGTLIGG